MDEATAKVIRDLMDELDDAYWGLQNIPDLHPARIAYAAGEKALEQPLAKK